jgi:hypothetical protein
VSHIHSIPVSVAPTYASVGTQSQQSLRKYSNLDLTEAQRTKLRSLFKSAKQNLTSKTDVQKQLGAILTPAQQQTITKYIIAGGGNAAQRDHGDVESTSQASRAPNDSAPAASSFLSPDASTLSAVTNIRNQASAAQSVIMQNLQQQVLATNDATTFA